MTSPVWMALSAAAHGLHPCSVQTLNSWLPARRRAGTAHQLKNYDLVVVLEALLEALQAEVQVALVACCCAALYVRFKRDTSGRTFHQQLADGSKQLAGAALLHCWNLLGAKYLATLRQGDECANYWLEIMVDTTVGVLVEWGLFTALLALAVRQGYPELAETLGGRAPDFSSGRPAGLLGSQNEKGEESHRAAKLSRYGRQLAAWLVVVTGMKAVMMCILLAGRPLLEPVAAFLLTPFMADPTVKLVVVMVVTPLVMNAVQFWLADGVMVHVQASQAPGDAAAAPYAALPAASP